MNNSIDIINKESNVVEDLNNNILSNYNYKIFDITNIKYKNSDKARAVYKIETNKGNKCLKKVFYDEGNLLFIYSVTEWLNLNNILCPKLISTKQGHKFVKYKNQLYILTDWIDGRKCDYDNESDIIAISHNLARIHKASYGFKAIKGSKEMNGDSSFYSGLEKHYNQLVDYYKIAKRSKDLFSKIYLQNFEYNYFRAGESIKLIKELDFSVPLGDAVSMRAICHLDYVNKNIIFIENNRLNVIDFDNTRIDLPVHDISYYLKRIMKREKTDWDFDIFCKAINSYKQVRSLSHNEYILLYALMAFPQKYWKISRDYYKNYKTCNSYNFINLLKRVNGSQNNHNIFCNQFSSDYKI